MKKALTLVVLLAMLLNTAGYYIVYEFNRYLLRKEFTGLLEHGALDHGLSVLTVYDPLSDPSFSRPEKNEILYHGNLYDVAKEVQKGKTVVFYCIHDKKEEKLITGMNSMHKQKKAAILLQHLVTIALPVTTERTHPQSIKIISYPLLCERFTSRSEIPYSPPPEKS